MQGDDSKEGRDSKRLSRAELLEMLIEQSKEVESLKKEVAKLQKQLDDRTIQLQQTGSIAEAAYGIPEWIKEKALCYLTDPMLDLYQEWEKVNAFERSNFEEIQSRLN